jgi:hypothetical protein
VRRRRRIKGTNREDILRNWQRDMEEKAKINEMRKTRPAINEDSRETLPLTLLTFQLTSKYVMLL